jgi:8-oxo-dGTP pyrophosphatase MutT (NUDIX family)
VPGGFGVRGIEGKLGALDGPASARSRPSGMCLGLQCMVIEYARNGAGIEGASSTEFDPQTPAPVVATMAEQKSLRRGRGRPRRHDAPRRRYAGDPADGQRRGRRLRQTEVSERHRHRYEVNNAYREELESSRPGLLRHPPRTDRARRVRRAARRRPPLLRVDPGAPGVPFAPQPRAPPLRRPDRGRAWTGSAASGSSKSSTIAPKTVVESEVAWRGLIFDVRRDRVDLGTGEVVTRDYIDHPGAVLILALREIDGVDHLAMIRQYRHACRSYLWELPAGLLDIAGEAPRDAAARELREEVDLVATRWDVLIDAYASAGAFPEAYRVFLARDLAAAPGEPHQRTGEEADLTVRWVSLDDAYAAALAGQLHNPGALLGIMAAWGARAQGWSTLRPHDAPWPEHPAYRF